MSLPKLDNKNVVRYYGCWAEKINKDDEIQIAKRVLKIK